MAKNATEPAPVAGPADFPDLRVTIELGATMPVLEYGNVRPLIRIEGVDPAGDVDAQIQLALDTAGRAFGSIDERFEQLISEIMSPASGKPGFTARVGKLEDAALWTKRNLDKIAGKVRELDGAQKAIVAAVEARQPASAPTPEQVAVMATLARGFTAESDVAEAARLDQAEYDRTRAADETAEIGARG